jgi:hypothetical protein
MDAAKIVELALGDYAPIRDEYRTRLYAAILDYLTSDKPITAKRNEAKRAVSDAFNSAADLGYTDGGGELPDQDLNTWVGDRQSQEFGHIDALFGQLREMRSDEEFERDEAFEAANRHADGYANTLDWIYNEAKMRGAKNKMLTFGGTDGHAPDFPCPTCKRLKYKVKRRRASWWVKNGFVPRPGNTRFECGCWQCKHFLFDDEGRPFTI